MLIGYIGEVLFLTGEDVATAALEGFQWNGSIRTTVHTVHGGNAVTEYTGRDADTVTLTITLSRELGIEPMTEITKLWGYMRNAQPVPLTMGTHGYGRYRWLITSLSNDLQYFDRIGDVQHCTVQVELQEYLREVRA